MTTITRVNFFYHSCQNGFLDNIVLVLNYFENGSSSHIENNLDINLGFEHACVNNNINTAVYLYNYAKKHSIELDISYQYEFVIRKVIEMNYIEMADWLFQNF